MKNFSVLSLSLVSSALLLAGNANSQILFSENFDLDNTANWVVNKSGNTANNYANFFFDYSTVGIPSAPNSGGSTIGLQMRANVAGSIFSGLSVSPLGGSFSGDYSIRYDAWFNYNGPVGTGAANTAGGNGTTQAFGVGLGTAGATSQWVGGVHDSLHFSMIGDGGSAQDYRVYTQGGLAAPSTGYYAAGTVTTPIDVRNDTHAYYASLGEKTAPAAQVSLFAGQTGTTRAGAIGFAWRDVEVVKIGNTVTWTIDGLLIATVDASTVTMAGNNILLNFSDTNSGSSTDPLAASLLFGLVDNLRITAVPEPTILSLAVLGGGLVAFLRRRR